MKNVIAIRLEPDRPRHLKHIALLRWRETAQAGQRGGSNPQDWTRAQMFRFVRDNPQQAYAISMNDDKYAFLEAISDGNVQYVKTWPDSTHSDNLLSLPRF